MMNDTENQTEIIPERPNRKLNRPLVLMTKRNVGVVLALLAAAIGFSVYFAVDGRTSGNNSNKNETNNASLSSAIPQPAASPTVDSKSSSSAASPSAGPSSPSPTKAPVSTGTSAPTGEPLVEKIVETTKTNRPSSIPTTESPTQSERLTPTPTTEPFTDFIATANAEVTIHDGSALNSTIPYYHCSGGGDSLNHIVLLHGASFTRDNWKRSGVLDFFCAWENVAVTAVDLPVSANRDDLRRLLEALPDDLSSVSPNVPKEKVAALVSPSASGSTVLDWLLSPDDVSDLHGWVQTWIPVACGSVLSADEDLLQAGLTAKQSHGPWPVWAIYGDQDSSRSSDTLKELSPETTTVVELPGPHAVYLHAQEAFVESVLEAVAINRRAQSTQ